jgi:protein TonB
MKKNENAYGVLGKKFNEKLEKSSRVFSLIGLVLTLFLVYSFIEYETVKKSVDISDPGFSIDDTTDYESKIFVKEEIKKIVQEKIVVDDIPEPEVKIFDKIEVKENDIEVIREETTKEKSLDLTSFVESPIDEAPVDETVPFIAVEFVPVFPGCKGNNEELKDCFSKKMRKHINKKFDSQLGEELGLSEGKKSIYVTFKIDKHGNVIDIQSRAPHPKLSEEAERIMKQLPSMIPARQGTKKVGVNYSIPIVFEIQ